MKLIISIICAFVLAFLAGELVYENTNILESVKGIVSKEPEVKEIDNTPVMNNSDSLKIFKDVGEPYLENFGLTVNDFEIMQKAGVDVIEGNFDICSSDEEVQNLLDLSAEYGIKVIMPAGSGEAEWGYECDKEPYPPTQKPVWDKESVTAWVNKWKNHPAVFAWDTSNEAGSVLPNAKPEMMLTLDQLKVAYNDVKKEDPNHPVMMRMNGWYFYDYESNFFRDGNPFAQGVADIVMVNAYSNVDEYFSDFVTTVTSRSISSIHKIDPNIRIFVALGAWEEPPIWVMPKPENLQYEIDELKDYEIEGIGFFKYGAKGSEWYLPTDASNLLKVISSY
jgi:hypothetical protein